MKATLVGLSLLGLALMAGHPVVAAESDPKAEALQHYELGMTHVNNKAYGEAIAEFNRAYELSQDFAVLYDIGQSYIAIDEPARAIKVLKQYLADGGKGVASARRKEVEEEIARQEARVATVLVHSEREGAMVKVDGADVGKTPLPEGLQLNAGTHLVAVTLDGYQVWEQRLQLVGGDRRNLEVVFVPVETAPEAATPAAPGGQGAAGETAASVTAPAGAPFPVRKTVAYVLGGVGVATLAVGAVFGVRAITQRRDSDAECPANRCSAAGVDLNNQAKTSARVADITIGIGLLSAAAATYLLLTMPKTDATPATTSTSQGLRLLADVGPGQAGLAVRGVW